EGDWNGDGDFTTRDLVVAFMVGRYVNDAPVAARPVRVPIMDSDQSASQRKRTELPQESTRDESVARAKQLSIASVESLFAS
ncbi:MAG: hypothetical protein KDB27_24515, partial [Planctomycetales bacterium]|nr:hypothetical protein [Planctomycetales bacterium]